jgi:photosystem II stability/assembly factor-like uncharacterized protein
MIPSSLGAGTRRCLAAFLVSASFSASAAVAGVNVWTPVGPEGGELCAVVAAPSNPATLWAAASFGGVFRSDDGGDHWTPPPGDNIQGACRLAIDTADPRRLYTVGSGTGFLRSLDGGASWHTSNAGLPSPVAILTAVATSSADPNFLVATSGVEVYRSRNRGDSWQASADAQTFHDTEIFFLLPMPDHAATVFASSYAGGVFRSDDFGDHWVPRNVGLPPFPQAGALAVDSGSPTRLFLSTLSGVYRTLDAGDHWSLVLATDVLTQATHLAVRPDGVVFGFDSGGRVLVSRDAGDTWERVPGPVGPMELPSTTSDFAITSVGIYVASFFGLERSLDDAAHWTNLNAGIRATSPSATTQSRMTPDDVSIVLSAGRESLPQWLRSVDRGSSWTAEPIETIYGSPAALSALATDPGHPSRWVASATLPAAPAEAYFSPILSLDDGATWSILSPLPCTSVTDLAFDPASSGRIYASGLPTGSPCLHQPDACFTFVSSDWGQTWTCIAPQAFPYFFLLLRPNALREGELVASGPGGVFESDDAGAHWTLTLETPQAEGELELFTDLSWQNGDTVFASSGGAGLFASLDGGRHWAHRSDPDGPGFLASLALDPVHSDVVFAASTDGVVRSTDGGVHWSSLSNGLPPRRILALLLDSVTPNRLLASLEGGGVWSYEIREPSTCVPSDISVCLRDGRFRLEAVWHDFFGNSGVGHGEALSNESSSFWFFDPANLELFVKELDGLGVNHSFWTFFGALSNVEYTLLATDTATGAMHGYFNPAGAFASVGDVDSFPQEDSGSAGVVTLDSTSRPIERQRATTTPLVACAADDTTLCLQQSRFAVSVTWRDFQDHTGVGHTLPLTADTGSFWFFDAANTELVLKVLDGTGTNDAFWVFYGSLSNVTFDLTVTDTVTGDRVTYHNPAGQFASVGDIGAFPQ